MDADAIAAAPQQQQPEQRPPTPAVAVDHRIDDDDIALDLAAAAALRRPDMQELQASMVPAEKLLLRAEVCLVSRQMREQHPTLSNVVVTVAVAASIVKQWTERRERHFRRLVFPVVCDVYFRSDPSALSRFHLMTEYVARATDRHAREKGGQVPIEVAYRAATQFGILWQQQRNMVLDAAAETATTDEESESEEEVSVVEETAC
jgi:hypothetical protein